MKGCFKCDFQVQLANSHHYVKVARLMGDLASSGGGGGGDGGGSGGDSGGGNDYFQSLAADLSQEMATLTQALEASEEALVSKMDEMEMQKQAADAANAKRKVATMARFLVSEIKADSKLSAAERKLTDKEEEMRELLQSLEDVQSGLSAAKEAMGSGLAGLREREAGPVFSHRHHHIYIVYWYTQNTQGPSNNSHHHHM